MQKKELRKIFIEKRKSISQAEKTRWQDLLLIQFQKLSLPLLHTVFTYTAMEAYNEIGTATIIDYLQFKNPGLQVAYPVCNFSNWTMQAVMADADTGFIVNKFGTLEPDSSAILKPENVEMVIVPLLCFDEQGYRVGYGKGFYDKYLGNVSSNCIKIGLSYFNAIDKIDDRNEFDVPLNYCITPERIYEF